MKQIIFLIACILFSISSFAQTKKLSGQIFSEDYTPINKATIIISLNDSVVGIGGSDEAGTFKINDLPDSKVKIYIRQMGYEASSDSIDLREKESYTAILHETSFSLDSITITGHRSPIKTPYGHIYFLSESAIKSENPFKALQEIPNLVSNYISESLSSADGKRILFLVDGEKMNTGLAPISPSRIESVEVIDVISAKYARTGAERIVNIHLKQSNTIYTYIFMGFGNTFPWKDGWTGPIFEVGNSKLSLYVDLTPTWSRYNRSVSEINILSNDYNRNYKSDDNEKSHEMDYQTMLKWRPSKNNYFIFSFQGNDEHSSTYSDAEGWHKVGKSDAMTYESHSKSVTRSHVYTPSIYYKHTFSEDLLLEGTASYTINNNRQNNLETQRIGDAYIRNEETFETKRRSFSQDASLSWKINDTFGFDFGNATDYSTNKITQEGASENFLFKSLNEYLYTAASMSLGSFSTVLSAGADYMRINSAGVKNSYIRPNISTDISFAKGISETSLEYKLSNTQPSISKLNPYNTSTDSLEFSSGNPLLVPERTHILSLTEALRLTPFYLYTNMEYGYMKDGILPYSYYNDGIYYSTYRNYGHYHFFNISQSAYFHYKTLSAGVTGRFGLTKYMEQSAKKYLSLSGYLVWSHKNFGMSSAFAYLNKQYSPYSETSYRGLYSSSLSVSYNVNPNLIFILGTRQTFGKTRYDLVYKTEGYRFVNRFRASDRDVFITIRWTLRKNGKKIDVDEDKIKDQEKGISL